MGCAIRQQQAFRLQAGTAAVVGGYLVLAFFFLRTYLLWELPWLLALALVPLVAQAQGHRRQSPVWALAVLAAVAFAVTTQAGTAFFLAYVVGLWWSLGSLWGRLNLYPVLLLLLGSPIFTYVAGILSFPLRLQLSALAAGLLRQILLPAEAAGNVILIKGEEFPVDPACAGLSMLAVSLLLAVFVLAHLQKTRGIVFPLVWIGLLLGGMVALNVGCNLIRIVLLVLFRILPHNPLHDVMGLLCLVLYALLPFYGLARLCSDRFGVPPPAAPPAPRPHPPLRRLLLLNACVLLGLAGAGVAVSRKPAPLAKVSATQVPGFTAERLADGVLKLTSPEALVYVKPMRAFYVTEHHPLICWEGSGFLFRQVREQRVGTHTVFVGELQQADQTLYTAWWMDNGSHQTVSQADWRWRMLRGETAFEMVNVTVAEQGHLEPMIRRLLPGQDTVPGLSAAVEPRKE